MSAPPPPPHTHTSAPCPPAVLDAIYGSTSAPGPDKRAAYEASLTR